MANPTRPRVLDLFAALLIFALAINASPLRLQERGIQLSNHTDLAVNALPDRLEQRGIQLSYYTGLVVFGASYNDNAHPRAAQYANTLRQYFPYSNYGGRYCNGPVAVEQAVTLNILPGTLQLGDYAYGGSHIDKSLTGGSAPATKDQVAQYLADVQAGTAPPTSQRRIGRTMHYMNTGINPLTAIWLDAVSAKLTTTAQKNAQLRVTQNVQAIASQLRSINTNSALAARSRFGRDYLIVGVPPLEIVPTFAYQHGDSASLAFLKVLSDQFNSQLAAFAHQFTSEVADGKVFWYDMRPLWYSLHANPRAYGITASPVTQTCYNSATGALCSNPKAYLYLDTLHPVTSVHTIWATQMLNLVKSGQTA